MYGESTDKYPVNIISAKIENEKCKVKNGKIIGLSLKKGKKYIIKCKLNINELFSSEVILIANRK